MVSIGEDKLVSWLSFKLPIKLGVSSPAVGLPGFALAVAFAGNLLLGCWVVGFWVLAFALSFFWARTIAESRGLDSVSVDSLGASLCVSLRLALSASLDLVGVWFEIGGWTGVWVSR